MKFDSGDGVLVVLHSPREKIIGSLDAIESSGVFVRGTELSYFDDLCQSVAENEQYLPPSDYFFPMWRIERLMRDEAAEGSFNLLETFEQRTGKKFTEL